MSIAFVVTLSPKIASNHSIWCLEKILGNSAIHHLFSRVQKGLASLPIDEFHVICQDDVVPAEIKAALGDLPVEVHLSKSTSRLAVLSEFSKVHGAIKTFLILPEGAIFPDCQRTLQMVQFHRYHRSDATADPEAPAGLLPEIFQASAIQRLANIGIFDSVGSDFISLMHKSQAIAGDDPELSFKTFLFREDPKLAATRNLWPRRLLVDDLRALRACEAVIRDNISGSDSAHAVAFKREMLAQKPENFIEVPIAAENGKIPLLFSTSFKAFSGAEECFCDLIAGLDRRRYSPLAVLPARGVLSEKLEKAGIPTVVLPLRFERLTPFNVRCFTALLERCKIQLVHINVDAGPSLMMAAHKLGLPIVTHVRSFMGSKVPELLQFSDKIITVSKIVREDILRSELQPDDVVAIYDGQTFEAFKPEKYGKDTLRAEAGIGTDRQVICLIARICAQKRTKFFVEALPKVIERFPKALALIVGEAYGADAEYNEELRQLVERLHLTNYVRFWGFEREIAKIHVLSDAMALCTEREPFGHCVLEALAMGLPTVTPASGGGHVEIIEDGENGILYDSSDPKYLSKSLVRLLTDPALMKKIAHNGQKTIQSLDIQTHVDAVSQIYDALLSRRLP